LLDETVDIFNSMFGRENLCLLRFEHMKEGCVTDFLRPLEKFTGLRFNVPDEIATCRVNHSVLDDEKIAFRRIENLTELMFTNLEKFSFPERYHTKLRKAELISPGLETKLKKFFAGRSAGYY
jgi:hypothetical protein